LLLHPLLVLILLHGLSLLVLIHLLELSGKFLLFPLDDILLIVRVLLLHSHHCLSIVHLLLHLMVIVGRSLDLVLLFHPHRIASILLWVWVNHLRVVLRRRLLHVMLGHSFIHVHRWSRHRVAALDLVRWWLRDVNVFALQRVSAIALCVVGKYI